MSKRPWFNEEQFLEERSNIYIPLDIQSPIHHPTLIMESFEDHPGGETKLRDIPKNMTDSRWLQGESRKLQKLPGKSDPQQININMNKVTTRSKVRRGKDRQTTNLSKFIFGIIKKLLDVFYLTRKLNQEQVTAYREFINFKGKLKSYENLLKFDIFRRMVRNLVESSMIVRKILLSKRMVLPNKLIVFKFLQNIRSICHSSVKRWKIN